MNNWLLYLLEVTLCQAVLCFLYVGLFRNLSFFQINRVFLLSATFLSFIIPCISIPIWNAPTTDTTFTLAQNFQYLQSVFAQSEITPIEKIPSDINWIITTLSLVYIIGFLYRFWKFYSGIIMVVKLTKSNEISEYNGIKTVQLSNGPSFFAFLNYLFINTSNLNISNDEFNQVIEHEKSHILQRHTIDNLLMELAILVCWFNPVLRVMKRELNNVHEFYADQKASTLKSNIVSYSKLILKLAFNKDSNFLTHQFSMNNIKKRIIMLNKIKDRKSVILRYLMIVPCLTILLATFSFKQKAQVRENYVAQDSLQQIIENIFWKGNKLYSDEYLTEYLGLKKGDQFDEKTVMGNLDHKPLKGDLTSLFMDRGYLMFDINLKKEIDDSHIDLTFEINEGEIYTINKVFVTGNSKVPSKEILKMTDIKKDQLFNRSKLASSQQKIIESGIFDPEKVIAYPIPHLDDGIVDIEFKVVEL